MQKKEGLADTEDNAVEQEALAPKHAGSTPELT
jgi:2-keto-3-deoxygluconate permease